MNTKTESNENLGRKKRNTNRRRKTVRNARDTGGEADEGYEWNLPTCCVV